MSRLYDIVTTYIGTGLRLGHGGWVTTLGPRPAAPPTLYEFEACPFCRKVREAATVLDLELLVKPCPKGGTRFRTEAIALGGKVQFPLLVDGDRPIYESGDIVKHLYQSYGAGSPSWFLAAPFFMPLSAASSTVRAGYGRDARPSRAPAEPLELWSYELSPYCRLVRERLCELELPYRLHNIARGSNKRPAFIEATGKRQFPYLRDPNSGTALFESASICEYLERSYAL